MVPMFTVTAVSALLSLMILSNSAALANANHDHLVSIPLIPHHVQRERRLKEGRIARRRTSEEQLSIPLIPHHVQRERRLKEGVILSEEANHSLRRRSKAQELSALFHGFGTHYVDLWCGTPPQRQTVIVDTGSGVTAFPCSACGDCGAPKYHIDNYFNEADSSTFHKVDCNGCMKGTCSNNQECRITMSYQEGSSWTAYEARDQCYVGGMHNTALLEDKGTDDIDPEHAKAFTVDLDFGCQTKITGLFKTQLADGIMGMEDTQTSFWRQMFDAGKGGDEKQFSLCFARPLAASRQGTEAGAMTLGGTDTRLHKSQMVFASRINKNGFFNVHVRKVYLRHGDGGESAQSSNPDAKVITLDVPESNLNSGGAIVDSGTTDTYFNNIISPSFRAAFKELSGGRQYNNNKWDLQSGDMEKLPTILIQLEGDLDSNKALGGDPAQINGLAGDLDADHPYDIILAIPPSHYMELDDSGKYTPRFYDNEHGGTVLGANAMMGHDVLFNIDDQLIGWAQSDCDYYDLVTSNGFPDALTGDGASTPAEGEQPEPEPETPTETEEPKGDSETPAETEEPKELETPAETEEPAVDKPSNAFDTEDKVPINDDAEKKDPVFPTEDIKEELHKMVDSCGSLWCRGGLLGSLFLICCLGFCVGRCCCGRSRKVKYERAEVELNGSFTVDGKTYRDDPLDDEYGEFEMK